MVSWVDTFKMPLREIEEKYTTSELSLMGLESRLKAYNMSKRFKHKPNKDVDGKAVAISSSDSYNPNRVSETEGSYILPSGINNGVPIPKKFFNKDGEMDLRLASGPEAATYLRKLGIQLAMPMHM